MTFVSSRTWVRRIGQIFHWSDEDQKEMLVQVVRLCVLYEDFQIEMTGAMEESIKALDGTSRDTRRFYFVRRHLATFAEIEGALHKLNRNRTFKVIRKGMEPGEKRKWSEAVTFFSKNHAFLKSMRDDTGGHFLDRAALFALENVPPESVAVFEVYRRGNGADVKLKFAYEFVAQALIKNREAGQTEQEFITEAFEFMADAMKQIVRVAHVILHKFLFERAM